MKKFAFALIALAAISTSALAERSFEFSSKHDYMGLNLITNAHKSVVSKKSAIVFGLNTIKVKNGVRS